MTIRHGVIIVIFIIRGINGGINGFEMFIEIIDLVLRGVILVLRGVIAE